MITRRLLAAPDKFRGTATAREIADVMAQSAAEAGWECDASPVSDGGEGLLECFGGGNMTTRVAGPLGEPVLAAWRRDDDVAVIEMAQASGRLLVGEHNDPLAAGTAGTGELIRAAIEGGAREITVGVGGSASTDGGLGAVDVLRDIAPFDGSRGYRVVVAADVTTTFIDAAAVFGPQKGATPEQVEELTHRIEQLAVRYRREFGLDVTALPGSGAAGGLAGGLAALGASIESGFDVVARALDLARRVAAADFVLTGEGAFDATSLAGKATGGVLRLAGDAGVAAAVVAGQARTHAPPGVGVIDLTARFGKQAAWSGTLMCVRAAAAGLLALHA